MIRLPAYRKVTAENGRLRAQVARLEAKLAKAVPYEIHAQLRKVARQIGETADEAQRMLKESLAKRRAA